MSTDRVQGMEKALKLFSVFVSMGGLPLPYVKRGEFRVRGGRPTRASHHTPLTVPSQADAEAFCRQEDARKAAEELKSPTRAELAKFYHDLHCYRSRMIIAALRK